MIWKTEINNKIQSFLHWLWFYFLADTTNSRYFMLFPPAKSHLFIYTMLTLRCKDEQRILIFSTDALKKTKKTLKYLKTMLLKERRDIYPSTVHYTLKPFNECVHLSRIPSRADPSDGPVSRWRHCIIQPQLIKPHGQGITFVKVWSNPTVWSYIHKYYLRLKKALFSLVQRQCWLWALRYLGWTITQWIFLEEIATVCFEPNIKIKYEC